MDLRLPKHTGAVSGNIAVTGSKSESNRLLILQALFPQIRIHNLSNSDDTTTLQKALSSESPEVDIHHAGTAMRFLTAYFACREGKELLLTGSSRMKERPVSILVEALRELGADIEYGEKEGFPPLVIKGKALSRSKVALQANVSSQYISALMLIAPSLPKGLEIELLGKTTSVPYILMTLSLLKKTGFKGSFEGNKIKIEPADGIGPAELTVESDWSSASYFYSIAALAQDTDIRISSYREDSLQGDRRIADIYRQLGVSSEFSGTSVRLQKVPVTKPVCLNLDLSDSPDLAQTIAVTCFGLGINFDFKGLHTLRIKETDRLQALENEIGKLGGRIETTADTIQGYSTNNFRSEKTIETYNDHRMAMAFAPLALKFPVVIRDAGVVSKSYPGFWKDLETLGLSTEELSA